jgi:D-alanine-D-alanine ligase
VATFETHGTGAEHPRLSPLKVAVIAGGESAERTVSLASGAAVAEALAARGHQIVRIDPAQVDIAHYDWTGIDVAFLALHGRFGEDGHIQALLEQAGVVYTGSDPVASRLGISKSASKERFFQNSVPTPQYILIHESDTAQRILSHAQSLGFPLVVKPDTQGSSLGVSLVSSPDELPAALTKCFHLDSFGILEVAIQGTEWTLGVLDDNALPLIQITTNRQFFDFQAKYEDDATGYRFEFDVTSDVVRNIERAGRSACRAIGTRGLARVDMMLDKFQRPWVLEVNTIPGFTDHSLVPKAAARLGWSLGEMAERALQSCLQTSPVRRANS